MPGISGILSKGQPERNRKDLHRMIECMMHESFYRSGTYVDEKVGLYVGWVCHQGSFSDCMPIINETKDIVLIFSGENFAKNEELEHLRIHGHEYDSTNATYLIHLYEEKGDDFLEDLNGQFHGILLDLRESKILLFNDRYGMQRLYYYESKDAFLFSSEAKSLLAVRSELRKIESRSLGEFFSCGCVLENRTFFSNIFLLPQASAWTFQIGKSIKKNQYFISKTWESQNIQEKEAFYRELKEVFPDILPKYFSARQSIGMSLTGGLDTRLIMACTHHAPGELPCYTFGSMYRESYDVKIARKVADVCHQPHYVLRVTNDFLSNFSSYAERAIYISDGCLDVCGSPELYINKMAREIAPIRMTGNYGSEVLRGIRSLKSVTPNLMLFDASFSRCIKEAEDTFAQICKGHELSFILFRQVPWYGYGRYAIEQSQLTVRMPFMDSGIVRLMYRAPAEARMNNEISLKLIEEKNPALFRIRTDMNVGGKSSFPIAQFIHHVRKFTFRAEGSYSFGLPHWLTLIDNSFRFLHPERFILGYHKFLHFRLWFRNELSRYVREILLDMDTKERPYLNGKFIEKIVEDHLKGYRNYSYEINKLLTTELIHRIFIKTYSNGN